MVIRTELLELPPSAQRQYIDACAVFEALEEAEAEALQVRGGMVFRGYYKSP